MSRTCRLAPALLTLLAVTACSGGAQPAGEAAAGSADTGLADGSGGGSGEGSAAWEPLARCEVASPVASPGKLTIDGRDFRDSAGRSVILRGVNTGGRSKLAPFFPFPFAESGIAGQETAPPFAEASETYVARIEEWGLNTVRLPLIWEAVEPERGRYDADYLGRVRLLVETLGRHHLRVVADMHQDLFARAYCGDGAPDWALAAPVPPRPENESCEGWFLRYLNDSEGQVFPAFDRFWANGDGTRDAFRAMWQQVAGELWPLENVVAFEVFNEPHPGSDNEQHWGREVLTPFYSEMAAAIREAAPGAPVFFDTSGTDATDQTFFVELPDGGSMVWAPHYYDPKVFLGLPINESFSAVRPVTFLEETGAGWNVPVFVGEFGAKSANPSTPLYLRKTFDALDRFGMHGTAWEYSTDAFDWNLESFSLVRADGSETAAADELVRAYPDAVAGSDAAFSFDRSSRVGLLTWQAAADGVTELAAPARLYPGGPRVEVAPGSGLCGSYDAARGRLLVRQETAGVASLRLSPQP